MNAIEVTHLRRVFKTHVGVIKRTSKEIVAVDDVSFGIQEGELFGLLGYFLFAWFEVQAKRRGTLEVF